MELSELVRQALLRNGGGAPFFFSQTSEGETPGETVFGQWVANYSYKSFQYHTSSNRSSHLSFDLEATSTKRNVV